MSAKMIGETLLGQFRIEEFINSGGMGAVYRVWDLRRNSSLAMKVLHADLADDLQTLKRFQREADALKELAHPNILPFYGVFQAEDLTFLLVAYVDGPTLKDILAQRRNRFFTIPEALTFLKALCAALGYAHYKGVIHCDVKPGNVMVDKGGNIFLTDFGIARNLVSSTTTLGIAGTPAYMAPEQIRGEHLSPAIDVYALGVLLYEMLSGQRPFLGNEAGTEQAGASTNDRICFAHLNLPPPDPRSRNPSLPVTLARVVLKALEKDPALRYPDTLSFFNACLEAINIKPGSVPDRWYLPAVSPAQEETLAAAPPMLVPVPERHMEANPLPAPLEKSTLRVPVAQPAPPQPAPIPGLKPSRSLPKWAIPTAAALLLVLALAGMWMSFGRNLLSQTSLLAPQTSPSLPLPTSLPSPTIALPTSQPAKIELPTATLPPPTSTPLPRPPTPLPTVPLPPGQPSLTLQSNSFCRGGPGLSFDQIWSFSAGTQLDIVGQDGNWLLVSFSDPRTRHDQCWISSGNATISGDLTSVPLSDYRTYK